MNNINRLQEQLRVARRERAQRMTAKALLPTVTLRELAKEYGISRERVRQVIETLLPHGYQETKQALKDQSLYFRCLMCGRTKPKRGKGTYCSRVCYKTATRYDLKTVKKCKTCKQSYFPLYNWHHIGTRFCSVICYSQRNKVKITDGVKKLSIERR